MGANKAHQSQDMFGCSVWEGPNMKSAAIPCPTRTAWGTQWQSFARTFCRVAVRRQVPVGKGISQHRVGVSYRGQSHASITF